MQTALKTGTIINRPKRIVRNAFIITAIMIILSFVIGYSSLDGMAGGYALIFFSSFLAMVAFVTALVYIPRAKAFSKLMNELNPLAHWTFTKDEWDAFVKEDLKETIAVNKSILRMMIIISIIICCILLLIYRDNLYILIIGALILFLSMVAFLTPHIRRNMFKKGIHEAYIGATSVYVGGSFKTWSQLGAHLVSAALYTESTIPILHIIFEYPSLLVVQQEIIRIPVPQGKMEEAKMIIARLTGKLEKEN
jgi:uncharacterized Tic20 family protein